MLIHPPPQQRHHGSPSSGSPLSQFILFLTVALTIPTCLFAQGGDSSPPTPSSITNGILNQYDLLLLTTSSTSSAQSILLIDLSQSQAHPSRLIPLPSISNFLSGGDGGDVDKNSEDKTTTTSTPAVNAKSKGCNRYDHVSGDPSRDLIYFSCDKAIGFLRIGDGESGVVHRVEDSTSITELHYFNNSLYWIEDQKKIKSLNTESLAEGPKDIISTQTDKIQGLAVNPLTGALYFSTWPHYSRANASIHEYDVAGSGERLLQSGLLLPKSVDSDGRGLYWISHPPGIYFKIEMIELGSKGGEEEEDKILVMRQAHQHGGSLAVHCGKVYWADVVDKRVWVVDGGNGRSVLVSDQILGEHSGLGFLKIAHGGKEKCDHVQVDTKMTGAEEGRKDVVMIKKMEGTNAEGPKKNSNNKETLLEKESYKVQNNGQGTVRLCSRGEAELLNCLGSERFCIVLGISSVPMCLSRQSQQPSPTNKTLLGARSSSTNNSLNSSAASTSQSQHQPRVQQSSSSNFPSSTPTSWPPEVVAVVSVVSTVAVIMTIISLFMTLRVRSLSRKPIIRRRVVVSRRASENGNVENNSPASVCEMIDIENCCNMNVCETPCYERTLLQPNSNSTTSTASANSNNNGTTTTTTTTVISVNSSNSGSGWNNNGGSCGGKEDKRCLLSI